MIVTIGSPRKSNDLKSMLNEYYRHLSEVGGFCVLKSAKFFPDCIVISYQNVSSNMAMMKIFGSRGINAGPPESKINVPL